MNKIIQTYKNSQTHANISKLAGHHLRMIWGRVAAVGTALCAVVMRHLCPRHDMRVKGVSLLNTAYCAGSLWCIRCLITT